MQIHLDEHSAKIGLSDQVLEMEAALSQIENGLQ